MSLFYKIFQTHSPISLSNSFSSILSASNSIRKSFSSSIPSPPLIHHPSLPSFPHSKHSLSITLLNFLPLVGNLTWLPHSQKPFLLYKPGDAMSLTLADFNHVSGKHVREATETRPLVPKLTMSNTEASVKALQITTFPNSGIAFHHAALNGTSLTIFLKSWAHTCRENLTLKLTFFYDRTVIKDPSGLDLLYLSQWLEKTTTSSNKGNPRSFEFWSKLKLPSNLVRQDFDLSLVDVEKFRKTTLIPLEKPSQIVLHLSTFVPMLWFAWLKAKGYSRESKRKIYLVLNADYKARLDPPIPENYFGTCIGSHLVALEEAECMKLEDGLVIITRKIGKVIKGLENRVLEGAEERLSKWGSLEAGAQAIGVSGFHRFGLYGLDFGWEKPKKMEIRSINRNGAFSMVESKDGSGGVEIWFGFK